MMLKAILTWAGIMAARSPIARSERYHNDAAHESANREQAIFSGSQVLVRRADLLSQVMETTPADTTRINKGVADMRKLLAEVARRADQ